MSSSELGETGFPKINFGNEDKLILNRIQLELTGT